MEHKKFKLKYEKIGVEKYLFVKSYCNRKGCSGSSTKRRILKCGKGREYSQLSLSFAWENGMNLKNKTKKTKQEHYFVVELHNYARGDHNLTQNAPHSMI